MIHTVKDWKSISSLHLCPYNVMLQIAQTKAEVCFATLWIWFGCAISFGQWDISNIWNEQRLEKCLTLGPVHLLYLKPWHNHVNEPEPDCWKMKGHVKNWGTGANSCQPPEYEWGHLCHPEPVDPPAEHRYIRKLIRDQSNWIRLEQSRWPFKATKFWGGLFHSNRYLILIQNIKYNGAVWKNNVILCISV